MLFFRHWIEVLANLFVHFKHVHLGLSKHSHHLLVAYDLASVFWVLEIIAFDMLPKSLHHLRAWKLEETILDI